MTGRRPAPVRTAAFAVNRPNHCRVNREPARLGVPATRRDRGSGPRSHRLLVLFRDHVDVKQLGGRVGLKQRLIKNIMNIIGNKRILMFMKK